MNLIKQKEPEIHTFPNELIVKVFAYKSFGNFYMTISSLAALLIWIYWFKVPFENVKDIISWLLVTFSFCLGILLFFWTFFGAEKIHIKGKDILFSREIFSLGIKKNFNKTNLSNFEVDYSDVKSLSQNKAILFGNKIGKIRFVENGKKYTFGLSLNNADADKIAEYINSRLKSNEN